MTQTEKAPTGLTNFEDRVAGAGNVVCDAVDALDHPLDRLAYMAQILHAAEVWTIEYADAARDAGHSWQQIADATGMNSRQAAQQRFRPGDTIPLNGCTCGHCR